MSIVEKVERNNEIVLRRIANWEKLADIGKDYGITRERVRQIVERAVGKEAATNIPHGKRIDFTRLPTTIRSIKQFAAELQVRPGLASVLCDLKAIRRRRRPIIGTRAARVKDIQVLKALGQTLGRTPNFMELAAARGHHPNSIGPRWSGQGRLYQTRGVHRLYYLVGMKPYTSGGRGHLQATTPAEYKVKRYKDITTLKELGSKLGRVPFYHELTAARGDCIATIGYRWKRIDQQKRRYTSGLHRLYRLANMPPGNHKVFSWYKQYPLPVTQKVEQSTMTTFSPQVRQEMQFRRIELAHDLRALDTLLGTVSTSTSPTKRPLGAFRNAIRAALKASPGLTAPEVATIMAQDGFGNPVGKTTLQARVSCDIHKLIKVGEITKLPNQRYALV